MQEIPKREQLSMDCVVPNYDVVRKRVDKADTRKRPRVLRPSVVPPQEAQRLSLPALAVRPPVNVLSVVP